MLCVCVCVVCVRVCVLCSPGRRPIDIPRGHRAVEAARSTAALATAQVVAHTAVATVAALPLLLLLRRMRRQRRSRCSNNMHSSVHHLQVAAQTARTTACELNQSSPHPRLNPPTNRPGRHPQTHRRCRHRHQATASQGSCRCPCLQHSEQPCAQGSPAHRCSTDLLAHLAHLAHLDHLDH